MNDKREEEMKSLETQECSTPKCFFFSSEKKRSTKENEIQKGVPSVILTRFILIRELQSLSPSHYISVLLNIRWNQSRTILLNTVSRMVYDVIFKNSNGCQITSIRLSRYCSRAFIASNKKIKLVDVIYVIADKFLKRQC